MNQASMNELSVSDGNNGSSKSSEPLNLVLVHESETTRIIRNGELGIRALIDPKQSIQKRIDLLEHEQKISRSLPSSFQHRKVLRIGSHQDSPAAYFTWVHGVTVGEWLRSQPSHEEDDDFDSANNFINNPNSNKSLTARLQVALAITKAVCDFHEAKLLHCHLSLDNIILDFSGGVHNCQAVLIDYSSSVLTLDSLFYPHDEQTRKAFIESKKQQDLFSLGIVLFSVLNDQIVIPESGSIQDEDSSENGAQEQRNKRGKSQLLQPSTNLPLYLLAILSSLLEPVVLYGSTDKYPFKCARDVFRDLQLATKKPDIYLKLDILTDVLIRPLMLPQGAFYGRKAELSMLHRSFDIMMEGNSKPPVLVVTGDAGVGKTNLLNQLNRQLRQSNGHMIVCKFTENGFPDKILASGFDSFFMQILERNNANMKGSLKFRIEDALGHHVVALSKAIPHLSLLLGRQVATDNDNDTPALRLGWEFLLGTLVGAISSQFHPTVLLFEDLHWASDDVLDTIQLIMSNTKIRYCLFCMSYRDTNASMMPKLFEMKEELQSRRVSLLDIKLGPIEKESVDSLVSEMLCMPPTLIKPLSSVICNKTGGTILFVNNLLKSLYEENLIYFNFTTLMWEFDLNSIISKEISGDVLNFLKERISRLSPSIKDGLKIAACLGSTFDLLVFQRANKTPIIATDDMISFAIENGYLQELPNKLKWSHDQLQSAAYSLIPLDKRKTMHLLLGTRIYLSTQAGELNSMIHDIVRNMNVGRRHLRTQDQKTQLAGLNLVAGKQSMKSAAFSSALLYFTTGIDLLEDDWQITNYDLGMKLFNSAIHMMIITGDTEAFVSTIQKPLDEAATLEDRLPANIFYVRFLFLSGSMEEAVNKCFSVLAEFGEEFPSQVTPEIIQSEIYRTEMLLANFPQDNVTSLPQLTDPTKFLLMKLMTQTILLFFRMKTQYVPLVGCRLIQLSVTYGWCFYSAFGLYAFGHSLINVMKKVDEGYAWVKLGLVQMKQLAESGVNTEGFLSAMQSMFYVQISILKEPFQATCEGFIKTSQDALMEGQIECAMICAYHSILHSFIHGGDLMIHSSGCEAVAGEMAKVKQISFIMRLTSHHCMVLKLRGHTDVSQAFTILSGVLNNEDNLLECVISLGDQALVRSIYFNQLCAAFWTQNYEAVIQYGNSSSRALRFHDIYEVFFEGLAVLRLAQRKDKDEKKWIDMGEKAVSTFLTWKKLNEWNYENKFLLLSAELHHVKGEYGCAEEKFKASIASAQDHKFIHEEGLAMEFLGSFYSCIGNEEESREMFANAITCYEKWGAIAVVERLKSQLFTA